VRRLGRFTPEELLGVALLVIVLAFVAIRPAAITEMLRSPYATPAPEGGPARLLVPEGVP
jgi:hypothetical protein